MPSATCCRRRPLDRYADHCGTQPAHGQDPGEEHRPGAGRACAAPPRGIPFSPSRVQLARQTRHRSAAVPDRGIRPRLLLASACGMQGGHDAQKPSAVLDGEIHAQRRQRPQAPPPPASDGLAGRDDLGLRAQAARTRAGADRTSLASADAALCHGPTPSVAAGGGTPARNVDPISVPSIALRTDLEMPD